MLSRSVTAYNYVDQKFIENLLNLKLISDKENEFLLQMAVLVHDVSTTEEKLNKLRNQKTQIFNDQNRLRQNLKSLDRGTSETRLRDKYISKLEEQEDLLEKINAEIKQFEAKLLELQESLQKLIKTQEIKLD